MTPFDVALSNLELEASITRTEDTSLNNWIQDKLATILAADSFEAINAEMTKTGLTPSKSLIGRTLEIQDFALRESADQYRDNSQLKKFTLTQAVDTSTGEEFIIDGGGDNYVAGIVRMRDLYGFPFSGTLLGMQTGSGNEMLYWRFHDPKRKPLK